MQVYLHRWLWRAFSSIALHTSAYVDAVPSWAVHFGVYLVVCCTLKNCRSRSMFVMFCSALKTNITDPVQTATSLTSPPPVLSCCWSMYADLFTNELVDCCTSPPRQAYIAQQREQNGTEMATATILHQSYRFYWFIECFCRIWMGKCETFYAAFPYAPSQPLSSTVGAT